MNSRAYKLIIKNKLRLLKGTLRHAWTSLFGLSIVGCVFVYQLLFALLNAQKGVPLDDRYIGYILVAVIVFNLVRVFLSRTPVFRVNAATLLYTYNTAVFPAMLRKKRLVSLLSSACVACAIAFVIQGFVLSGEFWLNALLLFEYTGCCSLLAWSFYHGSRPVRAAAALLFAASSALLYFREPVYALPLFAVLCVLELWTWKGLSLNVSKYYERLQIIDCAEAAQSQNNAAIMHQLSVENRPQHAYGIKLQSLSPSKHTALAAKSVIEIVRMQKQLLALLLLLLLAGWMVCRTNLLSFLPLLDDPKIAVALASLCTAIALNALYQILAEQIRVVLDKRLLGLALPFSNAQILLSYAPTALALNLLLALAIGLLYDRLSLMTIVFLAYRKRRILRAQLVVFVRKETRTDFCRRIKPDPVGGRLLVLDAVVPAYGHKLRSNNIL